MCASKNRVSRFAVLIADFCNKICHEPTSLAAVGEAAVAIECETEMRSQRSDGRVLLRIRIGIGCGNDDDAEPAAILATRRQHRCS